MIRLELGLLAQGNVLLTPNTVTTAFSVSIGCVCCPFRTAQAKRQVLKDRRGRLFF